jgi:hypothetical protein
MSWAPGSNPWVIPPTGAPTANPSPLKVLPSTRKSPKGKVQKVNKIIHDAPLAAKKPRTLTKTSAKRKKPHSEEDVGQDEKGFKPIASQPPSPSKKPKGKASTPKKSLGTSQKYDHIHFMELLDKFASDPFA